LGGLARDSFYAAVWQGTFSVADLVQVVLITHTLGLREYGRFALVVAFVSLVSQLFDVRVTYATMTFAARKLGHDMTATAGIFQFSYLVDFLTGLAGFVIVVAAAPFVGPALVGEDGTLLIVLYAVAKLAVTTDPSSIAVLRLLDRFRLIAEYGLCVEALRVALVAVALEISGGLTAIFVALIAYEAVKAVGNTLLAFRAFHAAAGDVRLGVRAMHRVRNERRSMLRMLLHTNVVTYARVAQTQVPTLLLGAVVGTREVGVYKVAAAAAAAVGRLADPATVAVLPRLSRLSAAGQSGEMLRLVKRASVISVPAMAVVLALVVVFRSPILEGLGGGPGALAGVEALVLLGLAQALNGALFWNAATLYATGRADRMARIVLIGAAVQLAALPALIVWLEATGAAVAFFLSMALINLFATRAALAAIHRERASAKPGSADEGDILVGAQP
jgi:O-antigen/teichoic acid export membrane protein